MLRIANLSTTMPGGWHALGDCGLYGVQAPIIRAGTFNDLVIAVMNYRIANELPVEDVRREVEEWICRNTKAKCRPDRPSGPGSDRKIGVADLWRFLKTMGNWLVGATLVDQAEAERRAEICAGCRFNGDVSDGSCWGCSGILDKITAVIGDRGTRMGEALKNCQVCGCLNKIAVWAPLDVLKKSSGELAYPEDTGGRDKDGVAIPCWKR